MGFKMLKVEPVEGASEIAKLEKQLQQQLRRRATLFRRIDHIDVPTPGGTAEDVTLTFITPSLWHIPTVENEARLWQPFGLDTPEKFKTNQFARMVVQFTRLKSGYSSRYGSFFGKGQNGKAYLIHSGKIGGGKKGIGKSSFLDALGAHATDIVLVRNEMSQRMKVAFIKAIDDPNLPRYLESFVRFVYSFKSDDEEPFAEKGSYQKKVFDELDEELALAGKSDEELRIQLARSKKPERIVTSVTQFRRNSALSTLVKRRANGMCEWCETPSPFLDRNGTPFLECHHITPLSQNGDDDERNALGLCPNCHRKAHYSAEPLKVRKALSKRIRVIYKNSKN
jgi:5-methylcytosine-specific restriction enzyme A